MKCVKCEGTMIIERRYTVTTQRLCAQCLHCGFSLDLIDVLRFFERVVTNAYQGIKIRETL